MSQYPGNQPDRRGYQPLSWGAPQPPSGAGSPPRADRTRRRWPWIVAGAVAVVALVSGISSAARDSTTTGAAATPVTETQTATRTVTRTVTATPAPPPAPVTQTVTETVTETADAPARGGGSGGGTAGGITDGTYEVGVDIEAGRYRSTGPSPTAFGDSCYWGIYADPNAEDIIQNDIVTGQALVELTTGTFFETSGCAPWTAG